MEDFQLKKGFVDAPDGETLDILCESKRISLKRLYELFRGSNSYGLVSIQFLAALYVLLGGKSKISKNTMLEFYWNLLMQALNRKNQDVSLGFDDMAKFVMEINCELQNRIYKKFKSYSRKLPKPFWRMKKIIF